MINLICSKCKIQKSLDCFTKNKTEKSGYNYWCKSCYKEYCKINSKHQYEVNKKWVLNNKEKSNSYKRKYYLNNTEIVKERSKQFNRTIESKQQRAIQKKKRRYEDLHYRLTGVLRARLRMALRSVNKKVGSAVKDLGCTIEELIIHLEKQFRPEMNWNNYGKNGWVIDHIQPLCSFDLSNREQLLQATHYTNLQPLWFKENARKIKDDIKLKKKDNEKLQEQQEARPESEQEVRGSTGGSETSKEASKSVTETTSKVISITRSPRKDREKKD